MTTTPNLCAAANGGGPSWLQSARLVAVVAELGSLGAMQAKAVVLLDEVQCQELDAFLAERIYEFNSKATDYFDGRLLGHAFKMKLARSAQVSVATLGAVAPRFRISGSPAMTRWQEVRWRYPRQSRRPCLRAALVIRDCHGLIQAFRDETSQRAI